MGVGVGVASCQSSNPTAAKGVEILAQDRGWSEKQNDISDTQWDRRKKKLRYFNERISM